MAKKPATTLDLSALGSGAYAGAAAEKLQAVVDRLGSRPAAAKAGRPMQCGPDGCVDHADCACALVDSAAETFALALHNHCLCCCDEGD